MFLFSGDSASVLYCKQNVGLLLKQSSIAVRMIPIISSYQSYDHSKMKIKLCISVMRGMHFTCREMGML